MSRWGDDYDSSGDEGTPAAPAAILSTSNIPPTRASKLDPKGIKTVTSYRVHPSNPNQLIKTVTKIKVTKIQIKENRAVETRRKWKKFGQAAVDEDQSNITIESRDEVFLDDPHADTDLQDEDPAAALAGNLNAFWQKQQRRQLQRDYGLEEGGGGPGGGAGAPAGAAGGGLSAEDAAAGWTKVGASGGGGGGGKYVPPGQRGAAAGGVGGGGAKSLADMANKMESDGGARRFDDRDQNTIRVTNISEDTTEADLQELFQPFGRISRVYLAKDKETLISRGFAFVSFVHREDAQRAMDKLQGFGYDHLILKLEWAKPSAPKDPSGNTEYRTGYGKALAQDTKEKVSFASNLTRGSR